MIQAASRLYGIQEYYFVQKLQQLAAMQQAGIPVINLGIGSPDMMPGPDVIESVLQSAAQPQSHGYQSYTGIPALRQAWADFYQKYYQVVLSPATDILPLMGSKEGIMHIAMAFLEAGDHALVPNPGYPTYASATRLAGATPLLYTLEAQNQWQPDWTALEQQDLSRVKIMWLNYPHMPTGAPASEAIFEAAVAFGRKHNILIVHDNPYSFILNQQPLSILATPGAREHALELNSLSKSHNMAGWRIGMLAGHPEYLQTVLRFKSNMDSGQFLPLQHAAVAALKQADSWFETLNDTYGERQVLAKALLRQLGCQVSDDQQGLFVWGQIPEEDTSGYQLSDAVLEQAKVFITPGGIFGSAGDAYVRVSLCSPKSQLAQAIERVGQHFPQRKKEAV